MLLKPMFVVTSLGFAVLAAYLYTPLPDGMAEPWKCQGIMAAIGLGQLVARTLTYLGLYKFPYGIRAVMEATLDHNYVSATFGDVKVKKRTIEGVPVVVYRPKSLGDSPAPGLVFFHGGGFAIGCAATYDLTAYEIAKGSRAVVVSVDYRRAPEHPFPAAAEDSLTVTRHVLRHGRNLGIDVTKVGVAGDSAGGNLAAVVSLELSNEDSGLPPLQFQLLYYPWLQAVDFLLPSYVDNDVVARNLFNRKSITRLLALYIGIEDEDNALGTVVASNSHVPEEIRSNLYSKYVGRHLLPEQFRKPKKETPTFDVSENVTMSVYTEIADFLRDPLFSPLMADDVSKVPPAFVHVAEFDILRDDGLLYIAKLQKAGVRVQGYFSKGGFHSEISRTYIKWMASNTGAMALQKSFQFMHDVLGQ
ncbi:arylacetamide deacetylase [Aplysia californica]|uniref:Arylacetamide deacetylase n=1 Tax=Aplysia californica TaxID=6500 RepID=A0ABM1A7J1_APLCA|nr:arylacetamide deacetylase [Aplysia californica]